ncbi:MAG: beta-galactosidase [Cohaesibacter sp.]|nr:beta-galactosidase [Cohaesibacter sp.]
MRDLGVCYYPEQWDKVLWKQDAERMAEAGLSWVRIGEFSWSRLEPEAGNLHWDWLDDAIECLGSAGLKIILGTPTATPPRWMLDKYPDMLAVDEQGNKRKFGSRRHYCFSHEGYRDESKRIADLMGRRYGTNPHIAAWQIDNEYGCHDTILSYSDAARKAFQIWLKQRYIHIEALNEAWGNVFWSMDYEEFGQIDLPNLTVTEPNPAHCLAFRRFSSDQVVSYNQAQAQILRRHSQAPLIHNYMGRITEFDHYAVGKDLDIASWDSYPIGFLSDRLEAEPEHKKRFLRQGDPDFQAFHHDLYRTVGKGRWWVMEQQPGPVNWAPYNPAPLPGMVRLWSWEAFAHGAQTVCYFRWRQAPFAQEQMHSGLLRPDGEAAQGLYEACQVAKELDDLQKKQSLAPIQAQKNKVALLFDYVSQWAWDIQPQGADFDYFRLTFEAYKALRQLGLSIDIVPPDADLSDYALILAPGLLTLDDVKHETIKGTSLYGPRSGLKTKDLSIALPLGPNLADLECKVVMSESLPSSADQELSVGGAITGWLEHLETDAPVHIATKEGHPIMVGKEGQYYLAGWPDEQGWQAILSELCQQAGLAVTAMPQGVRQCQNQGLRFLFNYNDHPVSFDGITLPAAGVHWQS